MNQNPLSAPIDYVKGIGTHRANILKNEVNIFTIGDLIEYFPFRYVDKTVFHTLNEVSNTDVFYQVKGRISAIEIVGQGSKQRLTAVFQDQTGIVQLVWFRGIKQWYSMLAVGGEYVIFGKPNYFNGIYNFSHPDISLWEQYKRTDEGGFLQPMYRTSERMKNGFLDSKALETAIKHALKSLNNHIAETLPQTVVAQKTLVSKTEALHSIHSPSSQAKLENAQYRLKFEELFYIQFQLIYQKVYQNQTVRSFAFRHIGELFNSFYNEHLPFELTDAQKRVVKEIRNSMRTEQQMNRLLQGDVGSGKTVVALLAMLIALDNGFQACLMAPTEILAQQHAYALTELLKPLPITVELLTGSTKTKARRQILEQTADGKINILIGTHALIEPTVVFLNLGLAVIDEQHRFGVEQRAKLWKKNQRPPHILVLTAPMACASGLRVSK